MNGNTLWYMIMGSVLALLIGFVLGREEAKAELRGVMRKKVPSWPW